MRTVEIMPIGNNKYRVTLRIDGRYEDDWIVDEWAVFEEKGISLKVE